MDVKKCKFCGEVFPKTEEYYYRSGGGRVGFRSVCKSCITKKEYRKGRGTGVKECTYPGVVKDENRKQQTLVKLYQIKHRFGVVPLVIMDFMNEQRGCCAICGESLVTPESTRSYHIDHDHDTKEVRGLLCCCCNRGIGYLRDNIDSLNKAIEYLTKK